MTLIFKKIARKRIEVMLKKYATNLQVLDLGSAKSPYSKWFPNRISVDIDERSGADIIADAQNVPLSSESQNFILCTEMLEHVKNPEKVVQEIYRLLKPGGVIVLTTRFVYGLHETPNDYFRYTKYGLKFLFKEFDIIDIKEDSVNFETIAVLVQRLVYQSDFFGGKIVKLFFALFWTILPIFNFLIKKQYGSISKHYEEVNILSAGYLIEARKPIVKNGKE